MPSSDRYEKSYMHRDEVTHIATAKTDFIITASCDGHVKFWKKMDLGIEFVKHFRLFQPSYGLAYTNLTAQLSF